MKSSAGWQEGKQHKTKQKKIFKAINLRLDDSAMAKS